MFDRSHAQRSKTELPWIIGLIAASVAFWIFRIERTAHRFLYEANDLFTYFLPSYAYEAERLRSGSLPLWNPYQGGGEPFLAMLQPGALYPARLLLWILDVPLAMQASAFLHLTLLVVATYGACRAFGAGRLAALCAPLVWLATFGVPAVLNPAYLEPGVWLPVTIVAAQRTFSRHGRQWMVLLGFAAGAPILAGGYQVGVYAAYGVPITIAALLLARPGRAVSWSIARDLAVAAILAVGVAAPQLLTTLRWTAETVRGGAPLSVAQIAPLGPVWDRDLAQFPQQLTLPVLALAIVGMGTSGVSGAILAGAAILAFALSLGPGTPWYGLSAWVPGLAMLRFPERLANFLVTFWCAIGTGLGATAFARRCARARRGAMGEAFALAIVCVALLPRARNEALLPWMLPTNGVTIGAVPLFDAIRQRTTNVRTALADQGVDHAVTPKQGSLRHLRVLSDYEPLCSKRLSLLLHRLVGQDDPGSAAIMPFAGGIALSGAIVHPELLDMMAVSGLIQLDAAKPPARAIPWRPVAAYGRYRLFANDGALPRAYLVFASRGATTQDDALDTVTSSDFRSDRDVVLVGATPDSGAILGDPAAPSYQPAAIDVDDPERVRITFHTDRPAILVLADAFAPGWAATVEGRPRTIWQSNFFVRGVVVGPGENAVEFTYHPPGFALGLCVLAASLAISAAVVWRGRRTP